MHKFEQVRVSSNLSVACLCAALNRLILYPIDQEILSAFIIILLFKSNNAK